MLCSTKRKKLKMLQESPKSKGREMKQLIAFTILLIKYRPLPHVLAASFIWSFSPPQSKRQSADLCQMSLYIVYNNKNMVYYKKMYKIIKIYIFPDRFSSHRLKLKEKKQIIWQSKCSDRDILGRSSYDLCIFVYLSKAPQLNY